MSANKLAIYVLSCLALHGAQAADAALEMSAHQTAGLEGLTRATASQKIGAPVEVYFKHLSPVTPGVDPSLQIAVVPTVAADGVYVEIIADPGVKIASGGAPMALQKVAARHQMHRYIALSGANTKNHVRVLAAVEVGGARLVSIFLVPTESAAAAANKPARKPPRKKPQV